MYRIALIGLPLAILLAGCNVHGTDRTEQNRALDTDQRYTVQVEIKRDQFVIDSSINVKAVVDGTPYPLSGHGEGIWSGKVPAACKLPPLNFTYRVDWKYLALLIPVSDNKTIPAEGALQARFNAPPPFQAPDELMLYGTSSISRVVEIKALHPSGVTLLDVSIEAPAPGSCWFGNCTGKNFALSNLPTLPQSISCGSGAQFNINFASTIQSSGVLVITTNLGTKRIPLSGKIFL